MSLNWFTFFFQECTGHCCPWSVAGITRGQGTFLLDCLMRKSKDFAKWGNLSLPLLHDAMLFGVIILRCISEQWKNELPCCQHQPLHLAEETAVTSWSCEVYFVWCEVIEQGSRKRKWHGLSHFSTCSSRLIWPNIRNFSVQSRWDHGPTWISQMTTKHWETWQQSRNIFAWFSDMLFGQFQVSLTLLCVCWQFWQHTQMVTNIFWCSFNWKN